MNRDDTNIENNNNQIHDQSEAGSPSQPEQKGSVASDLLHVLGVWKKKKQIGQSTFGRQDNKMPQEPNDEHDITENLGSTQKKHISLNKKRVGTIFAALLILGIGRFYFWPYLTEPAPPGDDIVASYNDKNISVEQLKLATKLENAKESEHVFCEKHGNDHTKCEPDESCESHPIDSIEGYRQLATRIAVEQMIQEWATAQGVIQRDDIQHGLKDLLENAGVSQLLNKLHREEITPESISSWDVQQYYNQNKEKYNGRTLSEADSEIRQILVDQKDGDFFTKYIEELKKTAGLQVDFEVLRVDEPTEDEIANYYNQNSNLYKTAEIAETVEIIFTSKDAQMSAATAIRNIRSGESFDKIASTIGQNGKLVNRKYEKGSIDDAIKETLLWKMQPDEISEPINNPDGTYSIVKLININKAGIKSLADVNPEIRQIILQKNMDSEYALRKDDALFSVHSRRYTLGDFYTEFKELSSEYQAQFVTYEQKKQLVEQLITKELLLEKTNDFSSDMSDQHSKEELKVQYFAQILHQQEVDEKLADPSDEELKKYYNGNKKSFIIPERIKISAIWIDQGQNGDKKEQAKEKAVEALSMVNNTIDFAEVAQAYSEGGLEFSGSLIEETYDLDHLPSELRKAISDLEVGGISEIIDYNEGFYIIKLIDKIPGKQMTYEESMNTIKEHLKDIKHNDLEIEMEKVLLKNANFTIYDRTLRKLVKEQKTS